MILVVFLDTLEQLHGVLHRRLVDRHRLESALQCAVLLDVLAVFIKRGRADHLEFSAGERRLEHVRGVHRALGIPSGADKVVYLVYEQHYVACRLYLVDKGLHAALELSAELSPCNQRRQVKQIQLLAL